MAQCSSLWADLHIPEEGKYQDQVKGLIEKTASSLDDTALKMLFVSVQQNNIELCIRYAINEYVMFSYCWPDLILTVFSLLDEIGIKSTVCPHHCNPNDYLKFNSIQDNMTWATMLWFGHTYVSDHPIYWTGYSLFYKIVTSKCQHAICKYVMSFKNYHQFTFVSEKCWRKLRRKRAMWN